MDNFSGLINVLTQVTDSYSSGIGGNYHNAELTIKTFSGNVIRDELGNYVPETATDLILKVRFYHDKRTQMQVDPAYNENRTYLKGDLVDPLEYDGVFPDRVPCVMIQDNDRVEGNFQIINNIPDAIAENISTSKALGRKICGYFERQNLSI